MIELGIPVSLTPGEVMAMVEASSDALLKRLQWSIRPDSRWRDLELPYAQQMIRDLSNAHGKLYMTTRDLGQIHNEFTKAFTFSDEVYELIDLILDADDWDDIEPHEDFCHMCKEIERTPNDDTRTT